MLAGITALGAAAFFLASAGRVLVIDTYELVDAARVRVSTYASSAAWTRVTGVSETSSQVHITVKLWEWPVPQAGIGEPLDLTVTLDAPLGDRRVTDGLHEVPRRP